MNERYKLTANLKGMMFNEFIICYYENSDKLEIVKTNRNNNNKIVNEKECKYGVTLLSDILDNPRVISIPEASGLLGIEPYVLMKFSAIFGS